MERKEQIEKAKIEFLDSCGSLDPSQWTERSIGFEFGAEYADNNPGDKSHFKNTCLENIQLKELIEKYASYMKTANYHQMSDAMLTDLRNLTK